MDGMLYREATCQGCYGSGKGLNGHDPCTLCVGTGLILTPLGRELLKLMELVFDLQRKGIE